MTLQVQRFSIVSSRPSDEIVTKLTATIGHPDINAFHHAVAAARTIAELEEVVHGAIGSSELMEFMHFDSGEVLRKEQGGQGPKNLRLVVGNPLIMKDMAKTVPDSASYAPVTVLVDERADGVHLSYNLMASLLAPYGSETALVIATDLDEKVERLFPRNPNFYQREDGDEKQKNSHQSDRIGFPKCLAWPDGCCGQGQIHVESAEWARVL